MNLEHLECAPCLDLAGAGPEKEPHLQLRIVMDMQGRSTFRCSTCHGFWTLTRNGWDRFANRPRGRRVPGATRL
jgi:hypothetical protein